MEISERPLISMWSEIISKIENMKGRIQVEIENLKQELRSRERERGCLLCQQIKMYINECE